MDGARTQSHELPAPLAMSLSVGGTFGMPFSTVNRFLMKKLNLAEFIKIGWLRFLKTEEPKMFAGSHPPEHLHKACNDIAS